MALAEIGTDPTVGISRDRGVVVLRLVLMIYPYFVSNILLMFGIAAVLVLGLSLAVRRGL